MGDYLIEHRVFHKKIICIYNKTHENVSPNDTNLMLKYGVNILEYDSKTLKLTTQKERHYNDCFQRKHHLTRFMQ